MISGDYPFWAQSVDFLKQKLENEYLFGVFLIIFSYEEKENIYFNKLKIKKYPVKFLPSLNRHYSFFLGCPQASKTCRKVSNAINKNNFMINKNRIHEIRRMFTKFISISFRLRDIFNRLVYPHENFITAVARLCRTQKFKR